MSRAKDKGKKSPTAGLVERALVGPLQYLTDQISLKDLSDSRSANKSIFLGFSPQLYNRKLVERIYLPFELLLKHAYLIGSSGSGKTHLIRLMILELARLLQGFGVLDIEGDLSQIILKYLASMATTDRQLKEIGDRVVLIEPFNRDFAPAFNPLSAKDVQDAYRQSLDMLGIFKRIWQDVSWGARMEELLRNLLLTLSLTGFTLGEAQSFLVDPDFRQMTVDRVPDQDLRLYWNSRFGSLSDKMKSVYAEPVLNKITVLSADPLVRHVVSQKKSNIDFRALMDEHKWVIINVSKGALSENAYLLGSLFVSKIKYAALSRADQPEKDRVPFFLFVDEFQNFMGHNFEEILSEARKYRLGLILAHQNLAQIRPRMRESIFGNVGTLLFFRLGHNDINEISGEFPRSEQSLLKATLSTLRVGEVVKREPDGTFRKVEIQAIGSVKDDPAKIQAIRQSSIDRYYRKRADIDQERRRPEKTAILRQAITPPEKPKTKPVVIENAQANRTSSPEDNEIQEGIL
jgi:hypothetical protein